MRRPKIRRMLRLINLFLKRIDKDNAENFANRRNYRETSAKPIRHGVKKSCYDKRNDCYNARNQKAYRFFPILHFRTPYK